MWQQFWQHLINMECAHWRHSWKRCRSPSKHKQTHSQDKWGYPNTTLITAASFMSCQRHSTYCCYILFPHVISMQPGASPSISVFISQWNDFHPSTHTEVISFWSEPLTQDKLCENKSRHRARFQTESTPLRHPNDTLGEGCWDEEKAAPCVSSWQHPWPMTVCDI